MFDTVLGIPLHPLVVHAVVVLAPLTALLLVLFALSERLRVRIGVVLPLLATVTWVCAFVAEESGEALIGILGGESDLIEAHEELGEKLPPVLLLTAVVSWVLWFVWRRSTRRVEGSGGPGVPFRVLSLVGVVVGIGLTVLVVLVGHSGAEAVWSGVGG